MGDYNQFLKIGRPNFSTYHKSDYVPQSVSATNFQISLGVRQWQHRTRHSRDQLDPPLDTGSTIFKRPKATRYKMIGTVNAGGARCRAGEVEGPTVAP